MGGRMPNMGRRMLRDAARSEVEYRAIDPLANKVGSCATFFFIVLFVGLGVGLAIVVARLGGNPDAVGPVAIGVGLLGGIVAGALVGRGVGRLLRRLLFR